MNKPLMALAGLIAAGGIAAGALVVASPGGEEEVVQQVETATATATPSSSPMPTGPTSAATPVPSSTASDLPAPAEGYTWYITPQNRAFDYGLPLYAVQVPTGYTRTPSGQYYGNPETFIPGEAVAYSTRIIVRITPAEAVLSHGFQNELPWQSGVLCDSLPVGNVDSALTTWSVFDFKCPEAETGRCAANDQKAEIDCTSAEPDSPVPDFDGQAAEMRLGNFVYSILVFRPDGREDAESAFDKAIDSFTLR